MSKSIKFSDHFERSEGRRPRVLLAVLEPLASPQNPHELANLLADAGFDVDIASKTQSVRSALNQAHENDVHLVVVQHFFEDITPEIKMAVQDGLNESDEIQWCCLDRMFSKEKSPEIIFNSMNDYDPEAFINWMLNR